MLPKCVTKVHLLPHSLPGKGAAVLHGNAIQRVLPLQLLHHLSLLFFLSYEEPQQDEDSGKHDYQSGIHQQCVEEWIFVSPRHSHDMIARWQIVGREIIVLCHLPVEIVVFFGWAYLDVLGLCSCKYPRCTISHICGNCLNRGKVATYIWRTLIAESH